MVLLIYNFTMKITAFCYQLTVCSGTKGTERPVNEIQRDVKERKVAGSNVLQSGLQAPCWGHTALKLPGPRASSKEWNRQASHGGIFCAVSVPAEVKGHLLSTSSTYICSLRDYRSPIPVLSPVGDANTSMSK